MMKRFVLTVSVIFALLPLTAHAAALPLPETGMVITTHAPVKPIEAPQAPEIAPAEELAAPAPEPAPAAPTPVTAPAAPSVASGTVAGCGDNYYAQYIYAHESGCRLNAENAGGCLGIGQACPGSKVTNACPDLNYDCQNQFFTNYAYSAYGSWESAYNFWVAHSWW